MTIKIYNKRLITIPSVGVVGRNDVDIDLLDFTEDHFRLSTDDMAKAALDLAKIKTPGFFIWEATDDVTISKGKRDILNAFCRIASGNSDEYTTYHAEDKKAGASYGVILPTETHWWPNLTANYAISKAIPVDGRLSYSRRKEVAAAIAREEKSPCYLLVRMALGMETVVEAFREV